MSNIIKRYGSGRARTFPSHAQFWSKYSLTNEFR